MNRLTWLERRLKGQPQLWKWVILLQSSAEVALIKGVMHWLFKMGAWNNFSHSWHTDFVGKALMWGAVICKLKKMKLLYFCLFCLSCVWLRFTISFLFPLSQTALGYTVSLISKGRSSWGHHPGLQWQPWADHCLLWDQKGSKWVGYECFSQTGTEAEQRAVVGRARGWMPWINRWLQLCGENLFSRWF